MKAAYDGCLAAGVNPPESVEKFFGYEPPDDQGVVVNLDQHPCFEKGRPDMQDHFTVDVATLPEHVRYVRFVNSYCEEQP